MQITIEEIARLAGVSKTTVSRVINNKPDVSIETRDRVMELIAEYGFQPNAFAKAISQQKSYNIGLIIPHEADYIFSNPFFVEVMHGVSIEVDRNGYYLLICYPHAHNYVDIYRQKRVDGFILMSPSAFNTNIIEELNNDQVPFVSTARVPNEDLISVDVDNHRGGVMAVEHLISLGHRRIAYVRKPGFTSSVERQEGYQQALENHDIAHDDQLIVLAEKSSLAGGRNVAAQLLDLEQPPTAIFLANDILALGAMETIRERGLRVPEDISIIGFDDIPAAKFSDPPLTTVRQPTLDKGVMATQCLIQYLETGIRPRSITLDVELVVRQSSTSVKTA